MALARISGIVLRTNRRQGTAAKSGNAYDFTEANILVAEQDVTTVTYTTSNDRGISLHRGDVVDLLVEFGIFNGRSTCNVVAPWQEAEESATLAAV